MPCTSISISDGVAILGLNKRGGIGGFTFYVGAIQTFDVSDPSLPAPLSRLSVPSCVSDVVFAKGHAIAANDENGLLILDISALPAVETVGHLSTHEDMQFQPVCIRRG